MAEEFEEHIGPHDDQMVNVPPYMICSLTKKIMFRPVLAGDGETYEEEAIRKKFVEDSTGNEGTAEEFEDQRLMHNNSVKREIQKYIAEHPDVLESDKWYFPESHLNNLIDICKMEGNEVVEAFQKLLREDERILTHKFEHEDYGKWLLALHLVCQLDSLPLLKVLGDALEAKAPGLLIRQLERVSIDGKTPVDVAIARADESIKQQLVKWLGPQRGLEWIVKAVKCNKVDKVQQCLLLGIKLPDEKTLWHIASEVGTAQALKTVVDAYDRVGCLRSPVDFGLALGELHRESAVGLALEVLVEQGNPELHRWVLNWLLKDNQGFPYLRDSVISANEQIIRSYLKLKLPLPQDESILHIACREGDVLALQTAWQVLQSQVGDEWDAIKYLNARSTKVRSTKGETPLTLAVKRSPKDEAMNKQLLDWLGDAALKAAIADGNTKRLLTYLQLGACDTELNQLWFFACEINTLVACETVMRALESYQDGSALRSLEEPDVKRSVQLPLAVFVAQGSEEAKAWLKGWLKKFEVEIMLKLIEEGELECVQSYLALGLSADVRRDNEIGLHLAVEKGNINIVNALIEAGVDYDVLGEEGKSALHVTVENEQLDIASKLSIASALIRAGADYKLKDDQEFRPLDYASPELDRKLRGVIKQKKQKKEAQRHAEFNELRQLTVAQGKIIVQQHTELERMQGQLKKAERTLKKIKQGGSAKMNRNLSSIFGDIEQEFQEKQDRLVDACKKAKLRAVKRLIADGAKLTLPNSEGLYPLAAVIHNRNIDFVRQIEALLADEVSGQWVRMDVKEMVMLIESWIPEQRPDDATWEWATDWYKRYKDEPWKSEYVREITRGGEWYEGKENWEQGGCVGFYIREQVRRVYPNDKRESQRASLEARLWMRSRDTGEYDKGLTRIRFPRCMKDAREFPRSTDEPVPVGRRSECGLPKKNLLPNCYNHDRWINDLTEQLNTLKRYVVSRIRQARAARLRLSRHGERRDVGVQLVSRSSVHSSFFQKPQSAEQQQLQNKLIVACKIGFLKAVKTIHAYGAEMSMTDAEGMLPLSAAIYGLNVEIVAYVESCLGEIAPLMWEQLSRDGFDDNKFYQVPWGEKGIFMNRAEVPEWFSATAKTTATRLYEELKVQYANAAKKVRRSPGWQMRLLEREQREQEVQQTIEQKMAHITDTIRKCNEAVTDMKSLIRERGYWQDYEGPRPGQ